MPGKFVNLTFHGAGSLTGEDLRLKEEAIKTTLVTGDAMDEAGPMAILNKNAKDLFATPGKNDGLDVATRNGMNVVTMARVGLPAWSRPAYNPRQKSVFGQWIREVLKVPVEVLVLGGHHRLSHVWGAQTSDQASTRERREWFCAFAPTIENGLPLITVKAYVKPGGDHRDPTLLREGPFDVSAAFAKCKLLIVYGCNGATGQIDVWRECIARAAGTPPFILSWFGVHSFPRDRNGQFLSPKFWPALKTAAPGTNLDFVQDPQMKSRVLEAWFQSVAKAFVKRPKPAHDQSHLIFEEGIRPEPRGAGAIDTEGFVYEATDKTGKFKEAFKL